MPMQRDSDSLNQTTATALTTAGLSAFLLWIFGMLDNGHLFAPPVETATFMAAGMLPILKAIQQRWIKEIERDTGGCNGKPETKPEPAVIEPSSDQPVAG